MTGINKPLIVRANSYTGEFSGVWFMLEISVVPIIYIGLVSP